VHLFISSRTASPYTLIKDDRLNPEHLTLYDTTGKLSAYAASTVPINTHDQALQLAPSRTE